MEKFKHYNLQKAGEKAKLPQIPPFPLGDHSYRLLLVNLHNVHDFNNCYKFWKHATHALHYPKDFTHLSRTKTSSFEIFSPLSF